MSRATLDFTRRPMRTTLYAAFDGECTPVINVWSWDRWRLAAFVSDRRANGDACAGEHIVQCTVAFYDAKLSACGLPARIGAP